ncbi:hypothetical protein [Vibrio natriegens]|uniref:hypothetical protein n=1 Tax=Vibrio natriegens TaxID=691 RepID=UPI0020CCBA16|nr:hypothetical protein [Vibrio natriegens]
MLFMLAIQYPSPTVLNSKFTHAISLPEGANSLSHGGNAGSRFTIKQLNVKLWVRTNAKGEARIWVGATLDTSGEGHYLDAKYDNPHITLQITH